MLSLILWAATGAGLGIGLRYWARSASSKGWLATRRQGAAAGAVVGAALFFLTGRGAADSMNRSSSDVERIEPVRLDAEISRSTLPVLVDVYATWCGPCRALAPRIEQLARSQSGRIKVFKVNFDEAADLARRYQIEAIPTLLFFKNGKLANRMVGLPSADELESVLNSWTAPPPMEAVAK